MPAFITNTVHIQRYADAVYGVQVGSATLAQVNQDITSLGGIDKALNAYFAGSGQTNATVAANIVKNAGIVVGGTITAAAVTDATAYVLGQLNANKGNEGATIKNILNLVGNLTADPIYGAAAVKFNADVDRAVSYAGATDIAAGVVVAAAPFALTANTDTWTGTAGNDSVAGTEANFSVLDSLAAGAGTDTLTLSLASATNSLSSFNISGFENLVLTQGTADNTGTGVVLSLPDVTSITNIGSTKVSIISGITNAATALTIAGTSQNTTFIASEAAVAGTSDTAAVTLNAVTGAAQVNINTATANTAGFEAINLVSAGGTANSITLETNDTAGLATLTISGAQDVTVAAGTNLSTTAKTINASAATGKVTITGLGAAVHTITGGGAADSFTFGANYVGGSTGATRDIIDGGAGRDTLSITVARAVDTVATTNQTNLTSIEI